jgi:arylsulfatase A-like enzyme
LPSHNLIVVVIDRLGAGYLGPYGATWLDTPSFNRLASESLLIEHVLSDSPDLMKVYRSYWTGRHAGMPDTAALTLVERLSNVGYEPWLLTDDAELAEHPLTVGFREPLLVQHAACDSAAKRVEGTQLADLFATAGDYLRQVDSPFLLWIHAKGMQGDWDAPWRLRTQWRDEDEPDPPQFVKPPLEYSPEAYDPDVLLGYAHSYAAQVAVLDHCLGEFLSAFFDSRHAETTLLALTSPRGYPLGEHRRIGPVDNALYGELLRVPLMFRFPQGANAAHRAQTIAQPADVFSTLAEAAGLEIDLSHVWGRSLARLLTDMPWPRDRAVAFHRGERAIRTPAWFLRDPGTTQESAELAPLSAELYVKPDDAWELNEISDRLPDVVDELISALDNVEQVLASSDNQPLASLSAILRDGPA